MTYNGWKNYETWVVNLWISNDESTYRFWQEQAKMHWTKANDCEQVEADTWTVEEVARSRLAEQIEDAIREQSPIDETSLFSDLLTAALDEVSWSEIAQSWLDDHEEQMICVYTRAQAIDDGVLIDVSESAKEAGIKYPTAVTAAVWKEYVAIPDGVTGQNEGARLWDVLWMFRHAARRCESSDLRFQLYLKNHDTRDAAPITLKALCGPGDNTEPVITIKLPNED